MSTREGWNMLSDLKWTTRGLRYYEFTDGNGYLCELQKSSAAEKDHIWLGLASASPKKLVLNKGWVDASEAIPPDIELNTRMHLTREQAGELAKQLEYFSETGELPRYPYG